MCHATHMAYTWYGNQSTSEACRFGALAVIFPLIERMNIVPIINHHLPADPQAEFDYGTTLSLLMAARLYSPVALSNVAQWAQDSGADILWGRVQSSQCAHHAAVASVCRLPLW